MDISSFSFKWLIAIVKSWNALKFNLSVPVFQKFSGTCPQIPSITVLCKLIVHALHNTGSLCVYGLLHFPCIQKCSEILPDQCKIASSAPVTQIKATKKTKINSCYYASNAFKAPENPLKCWTHYYYTMFYLTHTCDTCELKCPNHWRLNKGSLECFLQCKYTSSL